MDQDLKRIEAKLDACLTLLLTIVIAEEFRYSRENCTPLWLRAMTAAQSLASSVSIDGAKTLPECADERMMKMIRRMRTPTEKDRLLETADLLVAEKDGNRQKYEHLRDGSHE